MPEEKKSEEVKRIVVNELPSTQVSKATLESGEEVDLITVSDALTEILEKVSKIEKNTA